MGLETGKWTKAMNSIADKLNGNKIANNKYFNWKDAGVASAGVVGALGANYTSGEDIGSAANGLISGLGVGIMARYGMNGSLNSRFEGAYNRFLRSNAGRGLGLEEKEFSKNFKTSNTAIIGGAMLASTAFGALGGAVNHLIDKDITAKSGAYEGASIGALTLGALSVAGGRYGGGTRLLASGAIGLSGAIVGGAYGAYEGGHGEEGGIWKGVTKAAVFAKVGKSLAMLGSERYAQNHVTDILKSAGV